MIIRTLTMNAALVLCMYVFTVFYDSVRIKEAMSNMRILKSFGICFLGKEWCKNGSGDVKEVLPEVMRTNCARCNHKQRNLIRVIFNSIQAKLPEVWDELAKKEDPNGEFIASFNRFLKSAD